MGDDEKDDLSQLTLTFWCLRGFVLLNDTTVEDKHALPATVWHEREENLAFSKRVKLCGSATLKRIVVQHGEIDPCLLADS